MGCPVIAYGEGGVLDTVRDGETGILFGAQTTDALVEAMQRAEAVLLDSSVLRDHALEFSTDRFKARISSLLQDQS